VQDDEARIPKDLTGEEDAALSAALLAYKTTLPDTAFTGINPRPYKNFDFSGWLRRYRSEASHRSKAG
jgi:hypothetical protein